jgi:hypothetical protein
MLRRDYFQAEIEKLAQVLAKILGLKNQGKKEESYNLINETLLKDFDLGPDSLNKPVEIFKILLQEKNYPSQKLDLLAQLLYEKAMLIEEPAQAIDLLKKVLIIFDALEKEHHQQSFENLSKRKIITGFLRSKYE